MYLIVFFKIYRSRDNLTVGNEVNKKPLRCFAGAIFYLAVIALLFSAVTIAADKLV